MKFTPLEFVADRANAIVVKEVRQAVKSKMMIVIFMIVLLLSIIVALSTSADYARLKDLAYDFDAGGMIVWLMFFELILGCTFVAFGAMRNMMNELQEKTHELVSVTGIRPGSIVWGKLTSVFVQLLVYYSAIAPFLAFAYLLGGVSILFAILPSVFALLLSLFMGLVAISFGASIRRSFMRPVASALFILMSLLVLLYLFVLNQIRVYGGMFGGSTSLDTDTILTICAIYACLFAMVFAFTVSRFMPLSSNRSGPVRLTAFVVLLLSCIVMFGVYALDWVVDEQMVETMTYFYFFLGGIGMASASVSRSGVTPRMAGSLPRNKFLILCYSPFIGGPGFGIVFGLLMFGTAEVARRIVIEAFVPSSGDYVKHLYVLPLYFIIYYGLGSLILCKLKFSGAKGLINFLLFPLIGLIGLLVHTIVSGHSPRSNDLASYFNPFGALDRIDGHGGAGGVVPFVVVVAGLVLLANLPKIMLDYKKLGDLLSQRARALEQQRPSKEVGNAASGDV